MTRKDCIAIAAALQDAKRTACGFTGETAAKDTAAVFAHKIASVLAADNPRFDRAKFLAACGIQQEG